MNPIFKNLIVFLATVVLIAIGGEAYYRFINPEVLGNTGSLSYQKWAKQNIQLNSWGFRDKPRSVEKPSPETHRVIVMGPSNIYGQAISKLEERLTERLEVKLSQDPDITRPIEVVNFGTMTLDLIGTSMKLTQGLIKSKVEFDSIVLYYTWNAIKHIPEVGNRYRKIKKSHYQDSKPNSISHALKNSYLYDWVKHVSKDKGYKLEGKTYTDWHLGFYQQPRYFKQHIDTLKRLNQLVNNQGAKLYVLITPISYNEEERANYQDVSQRVVQAINNSGIIIVDARHIYNGIAKEDIPVSKYDGHNKSKFYGDMVDILVPKMKANILQGQIANGNT